MNTDSDNLQIKSSNSGWLERGYGLMKNAWKGIDPLKELEKMRNEWKRGILQI